MNACDRWVVCGPGEWAGGRMSSVCFLRRVCLCVCVCYVQEAGCARSSWTPAVCASARHLIFAGHAHSVSSFYLLTHTHTQTQMLACTLSFPLWCHRFGAPWQQWARKQERMREGKRTDIISWWRDEAVINSSWCSSVSDDGDGWVWGGEGEDWSPGNIVSLSSGNFRPLRVTPFVSGQWEKLFFFPVRNRHVISLLHQRVRWSRKRFELNELKMAHSWAWISAPFI